MKKIVVWFLLLSIFSTFAACKYEEGPSISLYSKKERMKGNFFFNKVVVDDENISNDYIEQSIRFTKDGEFYWTVIPQYTDTIVPDGIYYAGIWSFEEDKEVLEMTYIDTDTTTMTFLWDIKRLSYNDIWLERTDDTSSYRWELWKYSYY